METINVLWTGGLDSTYLVVKLLTLGETVQPYYVIDKERKSVSKELDAMQKISNELRMSKSIKGKLLDPQIVNKEEIMSFPEKSHS